VSELSEKLSVYSFRGMLIPKNMHGGILRYVEHGILPGDFLRAVISNDLREACSRADDINLHNLPAYVSFFYNNTPGSCWGSREKMMAWHTRLQEEAIERGTL
jgi:hypothetical protein